MISAIQPVLNRILIEHPPASVLCIGEGTEMAIKEFLQKHNQCQVQQLSDPRTALIALKNKPCYDFAVVANTIERLDKTTANNLLASLRDLHTRRLILIVPIGAHWKQHKSGWEETDLLALGFILKGSFNVDGKPVHAYVFDITTYKLTPDWLNSKHWANPEIWDKYWW